MGGDPVKDVDEPNSQTVYSFLLYEHMSFEVFVGRVVEFKVSDMLT